MLSPPIAPPIPQLTTDASNSAQSPTTRRRGLSYLRNLSSRDHSSNNTTADSSRSSPRHFFARSTSYQETKNNRAPDGRRRSQSHSRPVVTPAQVAAATSSPLSRTESERGAGATEAETGSAATDADEMTRSRPASEAVDSVDMAATAPAYAGVDGTAAAHPLPTIRMFPHQDNNRGRPSLNFSAISRQLPSESSIIRVGRYSEREGPPTANPTAPSDAPVGFKSKVVSRRHCEFCFVDGQWQIRDVASSSGTFLNHIRLSQPNQESRLYPVKDGDVVQLGIDFRGGEEMIFRCVKIRIECNRSWQKKPNNYNKQRAAQLKGLAKDQPSANGNSNECSICLGNVLPCQFLFVAPCAHAWHYKCIRPMLEGRNSHYPQFQCPNCRAYADLEADVDVDMADWVDDDDSADQDKDLQIDQSQRPGTAANPEVLPDDPQAVPTITTGSNPVPNTPSNISNSSLLARRHDRTVSPASNNLSPSMQSIPMPSRPTESEMNDFLAQQRTRTESPNAEQIIAGEGPLTPRNNAGPFVFDGSGSRTGSRRHLNVPSQSLDEISDGIE